MPAPPEFLPWDSEFFGVRIARARIEPGTDPAVLAAACDAGGFECTYLLVDAVDATAAAGAQREGFRVVDVRVTLDRSATTDTTPGARQGADSAEAVRPVQRDDIPRLRAIARGSFTDTRFYRDGRFPAARCADLYDTWITKDCDGRSDAVLVSGEPADPTGFITCSRSAPGTGQIGLVAVDAAARGRRTGVTLVAAAVRWAVDQGLQRISVVTQGSNIPALRAYESAGFRVCRSELWLHRWADEAAARG